MKNINNSIENIREYSLASHDVWKVKAAERTEFLKLDWNEATILPSPLVDARVKALISDSNFYNLYPMTYNPELMNALAAYIKLPEDYIQYFPSSDSLHEYICRLFLNDHRRVLILSPSYDNFRLTAESVGAEIIYSDLKEDFNFNEKLFETDIVNYKPFMVYICNPNNPTGTLLKEEYIEELLQKYDNTLFLIDEAYWEFSGITAKNLVLKYDNILISRTLSKAFALANFRFGYLISNKININRINKIRNPKNITTITQEAAIGALSDIIYMKKYVAQVNKTKKYFYEQLQNLTDLGKPYWGYGNFLMLKCNNNFTKKKLLEYLYNHKIFIRDITQRPSVYDCVRITVGTDEQMHRVVSAMEKFSDMQMNSL